MLLKPEQEMQRFRLIVDSLVDAAKKKLDVAAKALEKANAEYESAKDKLTEAELTKDRYNAVFSKPVVHRKRKAKAVAVPEVATAEKPKRKGRGKAKTKAVATETKENVKARKQRTRPAASSTATGSTTAKATLSEKIVKLMGSKAMRINEIIAALEEKGIAPKSNNLYAYITNLFGKNASFVKMSRGLWKVAEGKTSPKGDEETAPVMEAAPTTESPAASPPEESSEVADANKILEELNLDAAIASEATATD